MCYLLKDLNNIKLKSIPYPARNMPCIDKFTLQTLSKYHLKEILSVKLRPVLYNKNVKIYEQRHPVLKELLMRTTIYI